MSRKTELKTNDLITYSFEAKEFFIRNALVLVLGTCVVITGGLVVWMFLSQRATTKADVWERYTAARSARRGLEQAEELQGKHPDHPLALTALAAAKLQKLIIESDGSDTAAAKTALDEIAGLAEKAEKRGDTFSKAQARLILGGVLEFRADLDRERRKEHLAAAEEHYTKALELDHSGAGPEAQRRLERVKTLAQAPVTADTPFKAGPLAAREEKPFDRFSMPPEPFDHPEPKAEPKKSDKPDVKKDEPKKSDKPDVKKDEPKKTDVKVEPKKDEPKKDEPKKTDVKPEPKKDEPKKDVKPAVEPKKAEEKK